MRKKIKLNQINLSLVPKQHEPFHTYLQMSCLKWKSIHNNTRVNRIKEYTWQEPEQTLKGNKMFSPNLTTIPACK